MDSGTPFHSPNGAYCARDSRRLNCLLPAHNYGRNRLHCFDRSYLSSKQSKSDENRGVLERQMMRLKSLLKLATKVLTQLI